jgi:aspartyl/glutamyl-tRNA(Asn/Gln) amidotransferase C subunit
VTRPSPHTVDDAALEHLERLARLVIEPTERESLKADLVELLGFVDSLLEADVAGVQEFGVTEARPTEAGPSDSARPDAAAADPERPDVVQPSLPSSAALAMAPEEFDGFFKVPRTVEEG